MEKLKIIFLGTPKFGATILKGLIENNYKPVLVITAPDKPVGRKQVLTPPPVKTIAEKHKISVEQPPKIRNWKAALQEVRPKASREIGNLKPDLGIVAAYGQIIPQNILTIPKYGFLNVHPSLLPKYRGASPIQAAILNGDEKTGLTIILMDEKMDHGKIVSSSQFLISDKKITCPELSQKLAELGANLLKETIPKWVKGEIKPKAQNEKNATYTKIIKKEDGKIDWSKPAEEIERQIRAFTPWPGSFTFWQKPARNASGIAVASGNDKTFRVKILEADVLKNKIPSKICFKCGKDYLMIKKLQPEGKKPVTAEDFLRGYHELF